MKQSLRWSAVSLALVLALGLTACSSKAAPATDNGGGSGTKTRTESGTGTGTGTSGSGGSSAPSTAPDTNPAPKQTVQSVAGGGGLSVPGSPCLVSLPDKAPDGFTETGRTVLANKNASWTLKDSAGNSFIVSIVVKSSTEEAKKALDITKSLYDNPAMKDATFNGCQAFQRVAKDDKGQADVRVVYQHESEIVNISGKGPSASMDALTKLGKGPQ